MSGWLDRPWSLAIWLDPRAVVFAISAAGGQIRMQRTDRRRCDVVTVQHSVNHRAVAQALAKNRGGHEKSAWKVGMTTRGIDIFFE